MGPTARGAGCMNADPPAIVAKLLTSTPTSGYGRSRWESKPEARTKDLTSAVRDKVLASGPKSHYSQAQPHHQGAGTVTSTQTPSTQLLLSVEAAWSGIGRRPYFDEKQANPRQRG